MSGFVVLRRQKGGGQTLNKGMTQVGGSGSTPDLGAIGYNILARRGVFCLILTFKHLGNIHLAFRFAIYLNQRLLAGEVFLFIILSNLCFRLDWKPCLQSAIFLPQRTVRPQKRLGLP